MEALRVIGSLMVPVLALGMFGNLNLIYATKKFKELQTRNGILVAITASFNFATLAVAFIYTTPFAVIGYVSADDNRKLTEFKYCRTCYDYNY
ncbi:unnamed protein product [Gongylonema pulchrum]|uniref:7TM_GPCR_Srx domain-containing protein n=1 Tax=Gongylonema pulchrum TaxID=637853 RepID=A0A183CXW6_9BILA|nr:unnamed protein product [Gongylonema pulchrum]